MDATRQRRTRDAARQRWYANDRTRRFARFLGFKLLRWSRRDDERSPGAGA